MFKRLFLFLFLLTIVTINGTTTFADSTQSGSLPDDMAPYITGQLDVAPVLPGFYWSPLPGATWYRLYLQNDDGSIVYDEWFEAQTFCAESYCELLNNYTFIEDWGLLNGDYQLWIAAYIEDTGQILWSGGDNYDAVEFTVDVPPAEPPQAFAFWGIYVPTITIQLDANTQWYQLYVGGNGEHYLEWHSIDEVYTNSFLYEAPFCEINEAGRLCNLYGPILPLYWGPGIYQAWVQAWSPGGFSSPSGVDSVDSWVEAEYASDLDGIQFPVEAPQAPADLQAESIDTEILVTWNPVENGTWYHIIIENDNSNIMFDEWHHSLDICPMNCGGYIEGLDFGLYEISVQAWGPGGFSAFATENINHNGIPEEAARNLTDQPAFPVLNR